jgi:hypothetical protein
MSWGSDPSRWGKPTTVRFAEKELQQIRSVLRWGPYHRRETLSEFIRSAAVDRAELLRLREKGVTAPGEQLDRGEPGSVVRGSAERTTASSPALGRPPEDVSEGDQVEEYVDAAPATYDAPPRKPRKRRTRRGGGDRPQRPRRHTSARARPGCAVAGCKRSLKAKGLCGAHYNASKRRKGVAW